MLDDHFEDILNENTLDEVSLNPLTKHPSIQENVLAEAISLENLEGSVIYISNNDEIILDSLNQIVGRKARKQLRNLNVYIEADKLFNKGARLPQLIGRREVAFKAALRWMRKFYIEQLKEISI